MIIVRKATELDIDKVWIFFKKIIKREDSFIFYANTKKRQFKEFWFTKFAEQFVAEENDVIIGAYYIKPNHIDLGSHVANCGYMTNPDFEGKGVGEILCKHSIKQAKILSYIAIQFNIVVSKNESAVRLWRKCGFEIIGIVPKGFRYKNNYFVETYIMYKEF